MRRLILLVLLMASVFPAGADRATWAVEGRSYKLYRANFHIHTRWSRAKLWVNVKSRPWDYLDHLASDLPRPTLDAAADCGMDVIAFTDHCFQLDPWEWGVAEWGSKPKHYPDATVLGTTGLWETPYVEMDGWSLARRDRRILGLAGFEWTPDGQVGHINIIYPALDRGDLFGPDFALTERGRELTRRQPVIYARDRETGANQFPPDTGKKAHELEQMHDELAKVFDALYQYGDPLPFAQFNHPSQYSEHFDEFQCRLTGKKLSAILKCFCLFEIATSCTVLNTQLGPVLGTTFARNEPLYRQALRKGWHLAPAVGLDNFGDSLTPCSSNYTGVWATDLSGRAVAEAVHSRRVFATEVAGLALSLEASLGQNLVAMGSAIAMRPGDAPTFKLRLAWETGVDPKRVNGDPRLVIITKDSESVVALEALGSECLYGASPRLPADAICAYVAGQIWDGLALRNFSSAPIWFRMSGAAVSEPKPRVASPIFVLDRSGSMDDAQATLNSHAVACVDYLLKNVDWISVVNFQGANSARVDAKASSSRDEIVRAIRFPSHGGGGTAIYEAVVDAIDGARGRGKAMVVLMSDGENNSGRAGLKDAIRAANVRGVPCIVIGFCRSAGDETAMKELARSTTGWYFPQSSFDPQKVFSQYVVFGTVHEKTSPTVPGSRPVH